MTTIIKESSLTDDDVEAEREIIRESLTEIVQEVGQRMREAGLTVPVYLTVPGSGRAIMTMATPADPYDGDWNRITTMILGIISERLDGIVVRSNELPCGMANATMSGADITVD